MSWQSRLDEFRALGRVTRGSRERKPHLLNPRKLAALAARPLPDDAEPLEMLRTVKTLTRRRISNKHRRTFGTCGVCYAPHGVACQGVPPGSAHIARLQRQTTTMEVHDGILQNRKVS